MATARISELTIGTPLSGSELFEMTQETDSFSASAGMIKEYVLGGYAKISDVKDYTTHGGNFASGAWRTRDLNTIDYNVDNIVLNLASNQFTLGPGTYQIRAYAEANQVNVHVARLYNITDSAQVILGKTAHSVSSVTTATESIIVGRFTITNTKVFEIQHQCGQTFNTTGFGVRTNISGIDCVYTVVEIWKIK